MILQSDFYLFSFDEDIGFTRATRGNLVWEDVDPFLFSYNLSGNRALGQESPVSFFTNNKIKYFLQNIKSFIVIKKMD